MPEKMPPLLGAWRKEKLTLLTGWGGEKSPFMCRRSERGTACGVEGGSKLKKLVSFVEVSERAGKSQRGENRCHKRGNKCAVGTRCN